MSDDELDSIDLRELLGPPEHSTLVEIDADELWRLRRRSEAITLEFVRAVRDRREILSNILTSHPESADYSNWPADLEAISAFLAAVDAKDGGA